MESPSKILEIESPIKMQSPAFNVAGWDIPQEDFYGAEFLTEEIEDFGGMDIMQGFQKIGAGNQSSRNTPKASASRPACGRSLTSRF